VSTAVTVAVSFVVDMKTMETAEKLARFVTQVGPEIEQFIIENSTDNPNLWYVPLSLTAPPQALPVGAAALQTLLSWCDQVSHGRCSWVIIGSSGKACMQGHCVCIEGGGQVKLTW
jgi:hypothetical protein